MSENDQNPAAPEAGEQQFIVQRVYTKDLSFETPNSPAVFTEEWQPEINLELNTGANQLGEGVYEVVLSLTVTCKMKEKTAYLVEVQQGGIFTASGFDEPTLNGMLYSFCPNTLFPYAREVVSDLVSKGSFPQLVLAPINFDALYAEHMQQQGQQPPAQH